MPPLVITPLVKWTFAAIGGAAIMHWMVKEVRRINEELDRVRAPTGTIGSCASACRHCVAIRAPASGGYVRLAVLVWQHGLRQQDMAERYDEHEGDDETGHECLDEHGASSERGPAHWTGGSEAGFTGRWYFFGLPALSGQPSH